MIMARPSDKSCMIYVCDAILREWSLTRSLGSAGEDTSQPEYDGTLVLLHHLVWVDKREYSCSDCFRQTTTKTPVLLSTWRNRIEKDTSTKWKSFQVYFEANAEWERHRDQDEQPAEDCQYPSANSNFRVAVVSCIVVWRKNKTKGGTIKTNQFAVQTRDGRRITVLLFDSQEPIHADVGLPPGIFASVCITIEIKHLVSCSYSSLVLIHCYSWRHIPWFYVTWYGHPIFCESYAQHSD